MPATATGEGGVSAVRWLRGLWEYYREYTQTAVHAASAAALTAFGLLIFVNRFFVLLAIAAYVFPPILLYSLDSEIGKTTRTQSDTEPDRPRSQTKTNAGTGTRTESRRDTGARRHPDSEKNRGDTDSDSDDGDTDTDGDDGDTDSDSDDGDTDSDSDGGDSDSDSDDGDTDSDG